MKYINNNIIEYEHRACDRYIDLLRKYDVPMKYANEELTRAEAMKMPLWDWRHIPDPAEDKNAFVEAWKEMQCQNHHRELAPYSQSVCECITPDGIFRHEAVHHCEGCRYCD